MLSVTEFVFPPAFPAHTEKYCEFLLLRLTTRSKFADPLQVLWYFKLTVRLNTEKFPVIITVTGCTEFTLVTVHKSAPFLKGLGYYFFFCVCGMES
jgi:hypothetical protein